MKSKKPELPRWASNEDRGLIRGLQKIATVLLEGPKSLRHSDRDRLSVALEKLGQLDDVAEFPESTFTFGDISWRDAGTSVSLSIRRREQVYARRGVGTKFEFSFQWPCNGFQPVATAIARLEFYREIALLAAKLEATLADEYFHNL